jgi:lysine biosynthesis protein LysW
MAKTGDGKMARCPQCASAIALSKEMQPGDLIECQGCGTMLEVMSLNPFELDYALEDEDWDDWEEEEV